MDETYLKVRSTIRERKTLKVLGEPTRPVEISSDVLERNRTLVLQAISDAGWAPFHYNRNHESVAEPWRFHVLWPEQCRFIAENLVNWFDDVKTSNKLPAMLSACGALIIVNWLPQENLDDSQSVALVNEEHLAATAAAVQNLLLLLTALGMGTYWSSGGQLRSREMFERLGINRVERMLAAVFVEFPQTLDLGLIRLPGKQRDNRSSSEKWLREIEIVDG